MKKFLFLSILCYACNVVYGQHYIPVKKMISNYKEQKAIDTLKNHDIIYNIEESPEAGIFMEQSLLPSDLQRPKNIRAEWCFEYSSGQKAMLYLKKIYSSKEGKSNEASIYKNKLAEKYGKDDLGIPAIWYSGKITALSCPKDLFGEIVTKNVAEFDIEKGQVISRNFLDIAKTGTMEGPRRSRPTIKYSPIASTDGCWYSNLQYKLDLLEEFVNGNLKKHKTSTTKFGVDILLVTNKKGKTTGYLLSPNEIMNKENQALTEQLIKQISKLPRWSFGWLQTINGSIFQGRYVKANYSSDTGWKLEDYLH